MLPEQGTVALAGLGLLTLTWSAADAGTMRSQLSC